MIDYTVVLGIDRKTIEQFRLVWPTWVLHKPSLLSRKFLIFHNGVSVAEIDEIVRGANLKYRSIEWSPAGIEYSRDGLTKWTNPQRAKMLAGFVHVPAMFVDTSYWLKLDLDVVATGMDDWVDPVWFVDNPSIIAPSWGYTKPPRQMLELDEWVSQHSPVLFQGTEPLNLVPEEGSDKVVHPRICSWCAFFSLEFSKVCALMASNTCGTGQIPIDSQDGFHFYCAKRIGFSIRTAHMKKRGWKLRHSLQSVASFVKDGHA